MEVSRTLLDTSVSTRSVNAKGKIKNGHVRTLGETPLRRLLFWQGNKVFLQDNAKRANGEVLQRKNAAVDSQNAAVGLEIEAVNSRNKAVGLEIEAVNSRNKAVKQASAP